MDLVFEIISALQSVPAVPAGKTFRQAGGVIGRHADCDWVIQGLEPFAVVCRYAKAPGGALVEPEIPRHCTDRAMNSRRHWWAGSRWARSCRSIGIS